MNCKHCGFVIGDDDHRCQRCGRRVTGVVIAAPPGYSGANALAMAAAAAASPDTLEHAGVPASANGAADRGRQPEPARSEHAVRRAAQCSTPESNPVRSVAQAACRVGAAFCIRRLRQQNVKPVERKQTKKSGSSTVEQARLDFIPAPPSKTRKLKTDVNAQIFCDQPVATSTHRFVASAIDAAR